MTKIMLSVVFLLNFALGGRLALQNEFTVWYVDNLKEIGGHPCTVLGHPRVIQTSKGPVVEFDGVQDGLLIDDLPVSGSGQFSVEVIFQPDADGEKEQRFLHLQESGSENRILLETRLTADGQWFLDTYLQSGDTNQTLYAENFKHPVGNWYHVALVYDGREMRHYVNGELELAGILKFAPLSQGQTSIGVRNNRVYWFKGAIRLVRFANRALKPREFLTP